jgi:hypothetical protein
MPRSDTLKPASIARNTRRTGSGHRARRGVGINVEIHGGTNGKFANVHENFYIPVDFSIFMPVGVPFSAIFRQPVRVDTVITANSSIINANGSYSLGGTITAGLVNGTATATAPLYVKTEQSMAETLKGLSIGVNGLVVGWGGKFVVGLGKFGFVVGPYASLNVAAGVTLGSALQGGWRLPRVGIGPFA